MKIYEMSPNYVIYFQIFFNPLSFPPTLFSMLPSVHITLATLEPGNKDKSGKIYVGSLGKFMHPALKRQDRLGKEPFAGFGTVVEDITESGYTKNQPILLGPF